MVAITVVLAFLFFITVDMIVLKLNGKTHPAFEKDADETRSLIFNMNFEMPKDVLISKGHTMIKKLSHGLLQIGIDDFIQNLLKNFSLSKNIEAGKRLNVGDTIFESSAGNKIIKLRSPVAGVIKSAAGYNNGNVKNASSLHFIIEPEHIDDNNSFLSGVNAVNWMKGELIKLEDFLTEHSGMPDLAGVTMYDGGKMLENNIELIIVNNIDEFEKEFLKI